MKVPKLFLILLCFTVPMNLISFSFLASGNLTLNVNGFGFDSLGNFYIGKEKQIEKYSHGRLIATINPHTSRDYVFVIQNDDVILLSTIEAVYYLDLDGNVMAQEEDPYGETFVNLEYMKNTAIDPQGNVYRLINQFGRESIVSDSGHVIFIMPVWQYFLKLLIFLEFPLMAVVVIICIIRLQK